VLCREPRPAAMLDDRSALLQEQAFLGVHRVDPARADLSGEADEVEVRVIAPEAQPEPVLSGRGPVARPLVAPGLGQRGEDVVIETAGDRTRGINAGDPRRRLKVADGR